MVVGGVHFDASALMDHELQQTAEVPLVGMDFDLPVSPSQVIFPA